MERKPGMSSFQTPEGTGAELPADPDRFLHDLQNEWCESDPQHRRDRLRQLMIFELLARGWKHQQIAFALGSHPTDISRSIRRGRIWIKQILAENKSRYYREHYSSIEIEPEAASESQE